MKGVLKLDLPSLLSLSITSDGWTSAAVYKYKQEQLHKQQQQQVVANGKSPERSESPNSTSTATSAGTVTPPTGLTEFPAAPPLPPPVPTSDVGAHVERAALLGSICNFNKAKLRPAVTPVSTQNGDDGRLS
uniref:WH2 domain-containing protein n=1 Tax=Timema poppense TaxID=170557 RepID=A0A7R9CSH7_TIMPO|nr:unnamed protein product [Timema poppensis]